MFLKHLGEKLEAQRIYDGMLGKYETRFVVDGMEYAFLATSVGGDYSDNTQWMLEFENIKSHRIGDGDNNPAIAKAFAEAVDQWVKAKNPFGFFTYGSSLESLQNIIESVKKKVKKYNLIDDTADKKNEENGEVIPGNPVGKISWTKVLEAEVVDTVDREALVSDKFKEPFEQRKDIKPEKAYLSGTSKKDKLDKGDKAYDQKDESFADFKTKKLAEAFADDDPEFASDEDEPVDIASDEPVNEPEVGKGISKAVAKNNILAFLKIAILDMNEIIASSERPADVKRNITVALHKFNEAMKARPEESFLKLQSFTGDKVPEFTDKKIFGALQQVIGSEKDNPGSVDDMVAGFSAALDSVLSGEFQPSDVLNTVMGKALKSKKAMTPPKPGREFLQLRMKEMGLE